MLIIIKLVLFFLFTKKVKYQKYFNQLISTEYKHTFNKLSMCQNKNKQNKNKLSMFHFGTCNNNNYNNKEMYEKTGKKCVLKWFSRY